MPPDDLQRRHQRLSLRITALLLAAWLAATFGVGYLARDLSFDFFGWPFSFWVAAQGALIVYVLIVSCYARYMNRLDRDCGVADDE